MPSTPENRLPPGRQPYDGLVGLRVGAVAGGLLGALVGFLIGTPWLLLAGAILGAGVGYFTERSKVRNETQGLPSDGPDTPPVDEPD